MKYVPEPNVAPREPLDLAQVVPWLGSIVVASHPSPTHAVHWERNGAELDDDGPETWTGLPV
jgi:hypothetical protein